MNLVMFSGNSLRNRDWIHQSRDRLQGLFGKTYIQDYQHWQAGNDWIDIPHELSVISAGVAELEPYGVFAKSIGTALAVQATALGVLKPRFLLLMGLPLEYIEESYDEFAQVLAMLDVPVVVIHNTNDPVGSVADVREYLGPELLNKVTFIETPGETHDYSDYDLIESQLKTLIDAVT